MAARLTIKVAAGPIHTLFNSAFNAKLPPSDHSEGVSHILLGARQPPRSLSGAEVNKGVQQIPAVIQVAPVPAAAEARDELLAAIGAEAKHLMEKSDGHAATALAELARAYALVTTGSPSPRLRRLPAEPSHDERVTASRDSL
ncbi:hypothetical protein [Streptomyces sp. NPDC060031]|uniref:hypothetical protein n=1 Tax=Streptomyces sp. NPDC060031 TaxID=3347043 RepID=UPI0036B06407